jgi:hypothetical protein
LQYIDHHPLIKLSGCPSHADLRASGSHIPAVVVCRRRRIHHGQPSCLARSSTRHIAHFVSDPMIR